MKTEIENQERSGRKKRKEQVESWLNEVEQLKEEFRLLKEEATRGKKNIGALKEMNERVAELEQRGDFGELVCDVYESEECPMQDENVSSIGIYGFSIKGLQDDIAKIVKPNLSDVEDEDRRADRLNRAFRQMKNIVIILDDVWYPRSHSLEKLGYPLGVEGCTLILTSRSPEDCQKMGCKELLEVETLNTDDAWELFKNSLGCETLLGEDIERTAKSMAGRCKGLPLGLITLAGSMIGVTDVREWKNALNEFPDDMENDVSKVLKYSYDRLRDTTMQECFLYCGLYPEDYVIDRDELIDRFMMEGLVKGNSREEEFNYGHTILNKLVKLCLLEATVNLLGDEAVRMHDLLREMALRIKTDKPRYLVRAGIGSQVLEEQDWVFDLERVSFYKSTLKRIPEDMAPNCPTLSTLILSRCDFTMIPGSFFQYMNSLQVLDLRYNSELMDLPSCISNLGSLRALLLRGCYQLKSVPPLGKLKNLRVLDVFDTGIKEVPQGMENLVKLKFLDMGRTRLDELPKEILPKLSHLQYLNLPGHVNAPAEDLASLELLEAFGGGFCDFYNFQNCDRMKKLFPRAMLQDLKNLEVLDVRWCDVMEEIIGREEGEGSSQSSSSSSTSTTADLPELKILHLQGLFELKSICEGKLMCDSLEYMEFGYCSNLKRMPFYTTNEHPFPSLFQIIVDDENWWERLEWEQSHLNTLFQPKIRYAAADDDDDAAAAADYDDADDDDDAAAADADADKP
ncbi:hypothetical protein P3L10_034485 [Capsicum annuum]